MGVSAGLIVWGVGVGCRIDCCCLIDSVKEPGNGGLWEVGEAGDGKYL